jgi:hypothetical protein
VRRRAAVAALTLFLAACQTTQQDFIEFHAGQDPTTIAKQIAEKVGACWFDGKHKAFASYSYAPEAGASSTRILIVPKEAPHERPVLVVEVRSARRGTDVRLFGPLMQTGDAGAIRRDVMRWTGGAHDC